MLNYQDEKITLDDLVFEWRNKEYGAYPLRQRIVRYSTIGLLITTAAFVLALVGPVLWEKYGPKEEIVEEEFALAPVDLKKIQPPPIDPKTPPPPPMPASPPPPQVTTVRFIPPEIAPDEEVQEKDPPKQEELQKAVAGTENVQGDPNADPNTLSVEPGEPGGTGTLAEPIQEEEFTAVEEMPEFPGGFGEMQKFLQSKVKYPPRAQSAEIQGTVYVEIVVAPSGEISEPKVVKSLGFGLDEEAIRLIKLMPPFKPGKQNGRAVKVRMTMPIKFRLS